MAAKLQEGEPVAEQVLVGLEQQLTALREGDVALGLVPPAEGT